MGWGGERACVGDMERFKEVRGLGEVVVLLGVFCILGRLWVCMLWVVEYRRRRCWGNHVR